MDSVTQVILGAACGELVLGKKLGNRAMIWGGIGGTIPDLDVMANMILNPLDALAFHRGPMHSLLFAATIPFILGPLVKRLYDRDWPEKKSWKIIGFGLGMFLFIAVAVMLSLVSNVFFGSFPWLVVAAFLVGGSWFFYRRYDQIFHQPQVRVNATVKEWIHLFFWAIFTHPLLDSLTTFGTRLFWPFSNYRVSISNISIADPLYSVPFGALLLVAAVHRRSTPQRTRWVGWAVGLSSFYMILTGLNKMRVNRIFEESLRTASFSDQRYMTVPTILNNLLWFGIARQDSTYVYGYYSVLDPVPRFTNLKEIPDGHNLLDPFRDQKPARILPWFSEGFYNLSRKENGNLSYRDLRFGSMSGKMEAEDDFIFKFELVVKKFSNRC